MSDLTKDETCMHVFLYTTNTGLRERAPCPWCLETKVAALERENAVLEENAIRFSEERDRLRQSQSHEPRALPDAVCLSCGEKINWVDQPCMRASSETKEAPSCNCTQYNGGVCSNCLNGAHSICKQRPNRCSKNTKGGQS